MFQTVLRVAKPRFPIWFGLKLSGKGRLGRPQVSLNPSCRKKNKKKIARGQGLEPGTCRLQTMTLPVTLLLLDLEFHDRPLCISFRVIQSHVRDRTVLLCFGFIGLELCARQDSDRFAFVLSPGKTQIDLFGCVWGKHRHIEFFFFFRFFLSQPP